MKLLGVYVVKDAKTASDHRLGMIGWGFDLDLRVVSICFALYPLQGSAGLRMRGCRAHHRGCAPGAGVLCQPIFYYHSQPKAIHFRSVPSIRRSDQREEEARVAV